MIDGVAPDPSRVFPAVGREATDEHFMRRCLQEAERALAEDEVPIGAIVVHQGRIVGRGHNQRERLHDPTAHAEMLAITAAAAHLGDWRLKGCTVYVTLEPCLMCIGAMVLARIDRLVFGAYDPKAGACGSVYDIPADGRLNHRFEVTGGVLEPRCREILQDFFRRQRQAGKK